MFCLFSLLINQLILYLYSRKRSKQHSPFRQLLFSSSHASTDSSYADSVSSNGSHLTQYDRKSTSHFRRGDREKLMQYMPDQQRERSVYPQYKQLYLWTSMPESRPNQRNRHPVCRELNLRCLLNGSGLDKWHGLHAWHHSCRARQ